MKITLKAARVNQDLNLKEAAELLGIGEKTLWNYEKGITFPNSKIINKIEEVYKISYNNIIFLPKQRG